MEKVKVIFRKDMRDGEIIAFFPELPANYGNVMCYTHNGMHGEADVEYYQTMTLYAERDERAELLDELRKIYNDCELIVKKRMRWDDLRNKAWKR